MSNHWRDILSMSRGERIGTLVVLVLLVAAVSLWLVAHTQGDAMPNDPARQQAYEQVAAQAQAEADSAQAKKERKQKKSRKTKGSKSNSDSTKSKKKSKSRKHRKPSPTKPSKPAPAERPLHEVPSF